MTETETTKASNGAEAKNGQGDDVSKQIIRQVKSLIDFDHFDMFSKYSIFQVEYYFGDYNLPRDKFMQEQLKSNEDGWIGIDVMLKFQRLTKICDNGDTILQALKDSAEKLIEVDLENKKIRRNPEKPLPEQVKSIIIL